MTFKAKSAKSTATPLLKLGGQYVKSVNQYEYLRVVLDIELSDKKDIQRQLRYQYCAANKLRASFSRCSNVVKNYFSFLLYAHVCITIMVQFQDVMHAEITCGI